MHAHEAHTQNFSIIVQLILVFPFIISFISYIIAVIISNQQKKQWPYFRTLSWILGHLCAILTLIGPLAEFAHVNFSAHMVGHLLLGMLAPLLIALSAPMTLFLRTIPVKMARFVSCILRNSYFKFLSNPITASILNVGGLWLLYTTPLFNMMHENSFLYILIHIHIFLAGYLFTIAFIYIDPTPHQRPYVFRSIVLLVALTAHSILSKYIYANPPNHVPSEQAEQGAMIMYYGGDVIEIGLVYILFYQWFKRTRCATFAKPLPIK
ncbi:cytochrome c oxidase assembly protein [Lysinibacillus cavernae]|uniref:cytochrome c oxidase assembly protein n=1 Tax=Lysinibacillus cavernae TaxID=2666135 RepID=UPI0012D868A3|nr:cytochrome c oxidase assembly protein [Lysinibacillus cavernae]